MANIIPGLMMLFLVGAGIAVAFVIGRELVCWYFKINEMARDLHVIAEHYRGTSNGVK